MRADRSSLAAACAVGVVALVVAGFVLRWAGVRGAGLVVGTLVLGVLVAWVGTVVLVPRSSDSRHRSRG